MLLWGLAVLGASQPKPGVKFGTPSQQSVYACYSTSKTWGKSELNPTLLQFLRSGKCPSCIIFTCPSSLFRRYIFEISKFDQSYWFTIMAIENLLQLLQTRTIVDCDTMDIEGKKTTCEQVHDWQFVVPKTLGKFVDCTSNQVRLPPFPSSLLAFIWQVSRLLLWENCLNQPMRQLSKIQLLYQRNYLRNFQRYRGMN